VEADRRAVALDPTSSLAKNNLAYAESMLKKARANPSAAGQKP
jgi:hypothetical protein